MALDRPLRRRPGKSNFGVKRGAWIFLLPAAAIYLFVVLWPSIQGAGFAFTDWNGLNPVKNFIGFDNFTKLFADPKALTSVGHTLIIAITTQVIYPYLYDLVIVGNPVMLALLTARNLLIIALLVWTLVQLWHSVAVEERHLSLMVKNGTSD